MLRNQQLHMSKTDVEGMRVGWGMGEADGGGGGREGHIGVLAGYINVFKVLMAGGSRDPSLLITLG